MLGHATLSSAGQVLSPLVLPLITVGGPRLAAYFFFGHSITTVRRRVHLPRGSHTWSTRAVTGVQSRGRTCPTVEDVELDDSVHAEVVVHRLELGEHFLWFSFFCTTWTCRCSLIVKVTADAVITVGTDPVFLYTPATSELFARRDLRGGPSGPGSRVTAPCTR